MPDEEKAVVFLMPDGQEASNDPRYLNEKLMEQFLATRENTGNAVDTKPFIEPEFNRDSDDDTPAEVELDIEEMTVEQLKARVKELREAGVDVDTNGVRTKSELVAAIQAANSAF